MYINFVMETLINVLLLRKGAYPYKQLDNWDRSDETSLRDKKDFQSELYLENITDEDYTHAQKVFPELKLKSLGDYHDLYVQSDTLVLPDMFENFRNKCIEIYELDPAHFSSAPVLVAGLFKKDRSKIKIINRYRYVINVKKNQMQNM